MSQNEVTRLFELWKSAGGRDDYEYFEKYLVVDSWEDFKGESTYIPFVDVPKHMVPDQRFIPRETNRYNQFGERYRGLSYFRLTVPQDVRLLWDKYIDRNLLKIHNEKDLKEFLAYVSTYSTKNTFRSVFGKNYLFFKNLAHLGSNTDELTLKEIGLPYVGVEEQARVWTTGKSTMKEKDTTYNEFLTRFREAVKVWVSKIDVVEANKVKYDSIEEYLVSGIWATSGSSGLKSSDKELMNTKSLLLGADMEQLKRAYYSVKKMTVKVSPKNEVKLRTIITGEFGHYLKKDFLYHWIESGIRDHPNASMLWSSYKVHDMYEEVASLLMKDNTVALPIDIDKFDMNFEIEMENIIIDELSSFMANEITDQNYRKHVIDTWRMVQEQLSKGVGVQVRKQDGTKVRWEREKGFLSGDKMTALFGSISSFAYSYIATSGLQPLVNITQGDDALILTSSIDEAVKVLANYDKYNMPTNPRKFGLGISTPQCLSKSADYLQRTVYRNNKGVSIRGIPSRALHKILWKDGWKPGGDVRSELSRILTAWSTYARRSGTELNMYDMLDDMHGSTKISKYKLNSILHTGVSSGGLGLKPLFTDRFVKWTEIKSEDKYKQYPVGGIYSNMYERSILNEWWNGRITFQNSKKKTYEIKILRQTYRLVKAISRSVMSLQTKETYWAEAQRRKTQKEIEDTKIEEENVEELWNSKYITSFRRGWTKRISLEIYKHGMPGASFNIIGVSSMGQIPLRKLMDGILAYQMLSRFRLSYGDIDRLKLSLEAESDTVGAFLVPSIPWLD